MIHVQRVVGESIDLQTGQQTTKSLVLSNGISEVTIPVDDDSVALVLHLIHQKLSSEGHETLLDDPKPAPPAAPPSFEEVDQDKVPDDDFEIGEHYREPATGVASI